MRRKLVNYDVFQNIVEGSLSKAEEELVLAEDVLSKALNCECLNLVSFGESDALYETCAGNYVHATYQIHGDNIVFENIEEIVIEEESEKKAARGLIEDMVDSLVKENDSLAEQKFSQYLMMPVVKRGMQKLNETKKKNLTESKKLNAKRKSVNVLKERREAVRDKLSRNSRSSAYGKKINESTARGFSVLSENVLNWVDYKEHGPVFQNVTSERDQRGNITGLNIPNSLKRNEGRILSFNWKTLDHEMKVLRGKAKMLAENLNFCKAMSDLKRCNNISDNDALTETLANVSAAFPHVLYLTLEELSAVISNALESANEKNYDDNTCDFMAEAVLRTAHEMFPERVNKIKSLSGADEILEVAEGDDYFLKLHEVTSRFYADMDEKTDREMRVFSDLYDALHEVYRYANKEGDRVTMSEMVRYMNSCEAVLKYQEEPDYELAEEIATWLQLVAETNLNDSEWTVSNTTHKTINGDHPALLDKSKKPYSPYSDFKPDGDSPGHVSDGKNYHGSLEDEMRHNGFSNFGGPNTYPVLDNPYMPAHPEYTMKGEKGADKDGENDHSRWQSKDTWPNLMNPYNPDAPVFKAKSDNLVVDK